MDARIVYVAFVALYKARAVELDYCYYSKGLSLTYVSNDNFYEAEY